MNIIAVCFISKKLYWLHQHWIHRLKVLYVDFLVEYNAIWVYKWYYISPPATFCHKILREIV